MTEEAISKLREAVEAARREVTAAEGRLLAGLCKRLPVGTRVRVRGRGPVLIIQRQPVDAWAECEGVDGRLAIRPVAALMVVPAEASQ